MPSGNLSGACTYSSVFFSGDTVLCDVELYHILSGPFQSPCGLGHLDYKMPVLF